MIVTCCFLAGSKKKSKSKAFLTGLATNFGICALLFGYTLVGSVIFLAIEGGGGGASNVHQHQILATTSNVVKEQKRHFNSSAELRRRNEEARARTVESIWDITVSLNILYRDNWTRLAAQEITRLVGPYNHHNWYLHVFFFVPQISRGTFEESRRRNVPTTVGTRAQGQW